MAFRAGKLVFCCQLAHLGLGNVADGEDDLAQLRVGDSTQEISLVLEGVGSRAEPEDAVFVLPRAGVMPRRDFVEIVAFLFLEGTEFDPAVAHHIGVGREALAHHLHRVFPDGFKILVLQIDNIKLASVFPCNIGRYLNILLRWATRQFLLPFHPNLDIKDMRVVALLLQQRHHHGAIHSTRNQCGYVHCSKFLQK